MPFLAQMNFSRTPFAWMVNQHSNSSAIKPTRQLASNVIQFKRNAGIQSNSDFLPRRKGDQTVRITLTSADEKWMRLQESAEKAASAGDFVTAERMLLAALRETCGFEESDVRRLITVDKLSSMYLELQRYAECEMYCKASLSLTERRLGTLQHRSVAVCLNRLAQVYYQTGQYALAEPVFLEVLSIYTRLRRTNNADIGMALHNLAALYEAWRNFDQAEEYYFKAIEHQIDTIGARDPNLEQKYRNMRAKMKKSSRKDKTEIGIKTPVV
jgi:tetratricopeptide (TPR) repeat protein